MLLNRLTSELHPLYWRSPPRDHASFRVPTVVNRVLSPLPHDKPYLNIAVPYYSLPTLRWEPQLRVGQLALPLQVLRQSLVTLLESIKPPVSLEIDACHSHCAAVGLTRDAYCHAIAQLAGVVLGSPLHWSDAYRFNLRQAILTSGLVTQFEQVVFMTDAIAALLSEIHQWRQSTALSQHQGSGAVVISAGSSVTEVLVSPLPADLSQLSASHCYQSGFNYAGQAIDLDIFTQLIKPALTPTNQLEANDGVTSTPLPELHELAIPKVGDPDELKRYELLHGLLTSEAGQHLLQLAQQAKFELQQQPQLSVEWHEQSMLMTRQELSSQVILPYVQRLNGELNLLLQQAHLESQNIQHVICTGGTASLGAIARWVRQKFPQAAIVQDRYPQSPNPLPPCSRIAYGLALLPLYPHILEDRQHATDPFHQLLALLKHLPDQVLSIAQMQQILQHQGAGWISQHELADVLEHWPSGFMPSERDRPLLTPESWDNPEYHKLRSAPLFFKVSPHHYRPNRNQWPYCHRYLAAMIGHPASTVPSVSLR